VGAGYGHALQRLVGAVVDDLLHGGVEEHGEEGARDQQDHEAVERDLAEHERPVVGEDLAGDEPDEAAAGDALVEPVAAHRAELVHAGAFTVAASRLPGAGSRGRHGITCPWANPTWACPCGCSRSWARSAR